MVSWGFFSFISLFAVLARLLVATRGHNYDFASFLIVSDAINSGQSPWDTNRYNYGPLWAGFLFIAKAFSGQDETIFRVLVILCLTIAEIFLAALLWSKGQRFIGLLILLSPIDIIIVGYHNQIDILAILLAYISVIYFSKDKQSPKSFGLALAFLGLSLVAKHIFIFFPIWLAFRQKTWKKRALLLTVPYAIFVLGFLPFISSYGAIFQNVFGYGSSKNAALLYYFLPSQSVPSLIPSALMVGALVGFGWWAKKSDLESSFFLYMVTLVTFTSAMANQYLLIAAIGACGLVLKNSKINIGLFTFIFLASLFLIVDINGLHSESGARGLGLVNPFTEYGVLIIVLAIGLFQYVADFKVQSISNQRLLPTP